MIKINSLCLLNLKQSQNNNELTTDTNKKTVNFTENPINKSTAQAISSNFKAMQNINKNVTFKGYWTKTDNSPQATYSFSLKEVLIGMKNSLNSDLKSIDDEQKILINGLKTNQKTIHEFSKPSYYDEYKEAMDAKGNKMIALDKQCAKKRRLIKDVDVALLMIATREINNDANVYSTKANFDYDALNIKENDSQSKFDNLSPTLTTKQVQNFWNKFMGQNGKKLQEFKKQIDIGNIKSFDEFQV